MTDDQVEPARVRRHARPARPEPPGAGDGARTPSGYGQPAAVHWGPDAEGTVPGGYGGPPDTTGTMPGGYGVKPGGALPPGGRHAGQGNAPDRPDGSYQGSRRSRQPNGTQPNRVQGRPDPLTDPSYARRSGSGPARSSPPGTGDSQPERPGYAPDVSPGYGSGAGARFGGNSYPDREPGPRGGRYQPDDDDQGTAGYQRQPGYPRGDGSPDGRPRDGRPHDSRPHDSRPRDGRRPDDGPRDGQYGRGDLYRPAAYQPGAPADGDAAPPPTGPSQRDGRYAQPGAPQGRRHRNAPSEQADLGSYQGRRAQSQPPDEPGSYQGRRQRSQPPGPDEPGSYEGHPQSQPPGPDEPGSYEGHPQSQPPGPDEPGSYEGRRPQNTPPGSDAAGRYRGRRERGVPPGPDEPGSYPGRRPQNVPQEPDDLAAYRGRRHRDEPPAPPAPPGPGGPSWQDSHDGGYEEDDRFVPGLGGPRYRDDDDGHDEDGDGYDEDGDGGGRRRGRGSGGGGAKRRRLRWIAPLIAVAVILTPLIVGGVYVYGLYMSKYHPADYTGGGTGQAIVQVQSGQTATQVGQRLVTLGVVKSVRAFELAAEHSTNSRGLEPGFYRMHKQMQATLAFALLLSPSARIEDKITIPEGWRLSQIEAALGAKSGIPVADYQKALARTGSLGLPSYANGNPEGYLFPATYDVQPNMSATTVLQTMVNRFNQEAVNINLAAAAARANMTSGQVITIASLLQAEGGRVSDYPKIARVVLNRLNAKMPLQFDSTVLYGLHVFGTSATLAQTRTNTPYNTYLHKGLPPGPIDSPGNAAIEAALNPAAGNWLYFLAGKDGVTTFYQTLPG
jgi:UPF0755 protein